MLLNRVLERAASPLSGVSAVTFAALSAARGKRFFHPEGIVFAGTATFRDTSFGLPFAGTSGVLARFSRGAGLPRPVPDLFGMALRILDPLQDLLYVTSGSNGLTRHLLLPASGLFALPYSTVLPYELDERLIVFGAFADSSLQDASGQQLDDLPALVATGRLRFDLTVGGAGTDEQEVFGSVVVDGDGPPEVAFNPWNSHPALKPAGALNRLRRESYASSQAARPDR